MRLHRLSNSASLLIRSYCLWNNWNLFEFRFTNHYNLSYRQNNSGSYGKVWDQGKWAVPKIRCNSFIHEGQTRINMSLSFARRKIFDQLNLFLPNDCTKNYVYWVSTMIDLPRNEILVEVLILVKDKKDKSKRRLNKAFIVMSLKSQLEYLWVGAMILGYLIYFVLRSLLRKSN